MAVTTGVYSYNNIGEDNGVEKRGKEERQVKWGNFYRIMEITIVNNERMNFKNVKRLIYHN